MRTPFGSVTTADRFHPHDQSIAPNTNASSSRTKMPAQQQVIYHPNAAPGHYGSSAGVGGQHGESGDECDRSRADDHRAEGRRSRRASSDASPTAKRQRFEIIRKLGSGTYGKVSLALDHRTGEEVAVKFIKKSAIENTADLIRIRREIRIMSALKHPNIIEIKEVFENDEKIILVMEYSSGGELYDYVSSHGPLNEAEVRRLFRQITSAVYYCHKHGVAHRDLKLENILLDRNMDAKIADFGLSNYFKPHSLLHTFCGSPLYASPEIINGTPYKGPEVDCWSLGVLLYTLAYSSMPFDGRDFNRMIRQIKRGAYYEPDPPSSASMLIRSMLRVNPDRRADIDSIASHWWLNYDENVPSIGDLQENQVLDPTPLYIRQETLMIQSLGEENEVFAEYTHLADATRKKIEEFRRRKKEADWYLTDSQSPVKKQSKKRSSSVVSDKKRQSSQMVNQKQGSQASMAGTTKKQSSQVVVKPPLPPSAPTFMDGKAKKTAVSPSEYQATPVPSAATIAQHAALPQQSTPVPSTVSQESFWTPSSAAPSAMSMGQEMTPVSSVGTLVHQPTPATSVSDMAKVAPVPKPEPPRIPDPSYETRHELKDDSEEVPLFQEEPVTTCKTIPRPSTIVLLNSPIRASEAPNVLHCPEPEPEPEPELEPEPEPEPVAALGASAMEAATSASVETAVIEQANRLINQLMEEALNGPVSVETVETIRSSDAYNKEQFVKDILESVLSAQQPKPVTTPSTHSMRGSRSKHSSMSRMPPSTSSSIADGIGYQDGASTPPPGDVSASYYDDSFISPTAQLTITLPHHNVIHQTVPEEGEMEFDGSTTEVGLEARRRSSAFQEEEEEEEEYEDEEEEEEEDVYSTDFEDMSASSESEGAEEEPESSDSAQEDTDLALSEAIPISNVDSCASLNSEDDDLVGSLAERESRRPSVAADRSAPIQIAQETTVPEMSSPPAPLPPVFRRGLAKRLSRGKYERNKFIFGREISVEDSPRPTRRRIGGVQPQPKDAPKLFQKAEQYILQYPSPERGSPERMHEGRRRRYSDGDKKKEEKSTPAPSSTTATSASPTAGAAAATKSNVTENATPSAAAAASIVEAPSIHYKYANGTGAEEEEDEDAEDEMVAFSIQRRQERARERQEIMGDYNPINYFFGDHQPESLMTPNVQPFPAPSGPKKRTYVPAGEAKSVGATEPCTLQVTIKTRRSSAEPLLDILEAGGGQPDEYDGGTASYGMPRTPTLARPPSNGALNAEMRRQSYRSAMDDSMNSSLEGDRASTGSTTMAVAPTAVSLPPMSPPPFDHPQPRVRPSLNGAPPGEPYWLQQYNRDEHRHQTPTHYGHGGDTSDRSRLMSPIGSGGGKREGGSVKMVAQLKADMYWRSQVPRVPMHHQQAYSYTDKRSVARTGASTFGKNHYRYERPEDDYVSARAYGQGSSYRSKSVFTNPHSREISPARGRSLMSPLRSTHYESDPSNVYSRNHRAKSWYAPDDRMGGSYEDSLSSASRYGKPGPPRFESVITLKRGNNGNGGMANYFRSFFDGAYNRVPRMQDLKYDREKTPVTNGPFGDLLDRQNTLKRRSRSLDKSLHGNKPVDLSSRRPMPALNVSQMADDISTHSVSHHSQDTSLGMHMENVGGAGRFGSLLVSSGKIRQPPDLDKVPTKGILKKQSPVLGYGGRHLDDKKVTTVEFESRSPRNFLDRIRRHLSTEKLPTRSSEPANLGKTRPSRAESTSPDSSKPASKKRSLLQLGRRRTQEAARIGSGNESGYGSGSGSISSDEYTSHTSSTPIEKIKGFFGGQSKRESSTPTGAAGTYHHYSSPAGGASGALYVAAYRKAYQGTHRAHAFTSTPRY